MKLDSLARGGATQLLKLLNNDLKMLGAKYGVELKLNGGSLVSEAACKFNLEATLTGAGSLREQRTARDLARYAGSYLPGVDLAKPLDHPSLGKLVICGWNAKGRTMPVLARAEDGRIYKFSEDAIKKLAARS